MLVLSRKVGERIHIGNDVILTVLSVGGGRVRLGIEAPDGIQIKRQELIFEEPQTLDDSAAVAHAYPYHPAAGGIGPAV